MINSSTNASIAAASAAASAASANRAHNDACKAVLSSYEPAAASQTEMQEYADCVYRMYPVQDSPADVLFAKTLIVAAIVGMCVGWFLARRDNFSDFSMCVAASFVGAVSGPVIFMVGYGAYLAIVYLFTA